MKKEKLRQVRFEIPKPLDPLLAAMSESSGKTIPVIFLQLAIDHFVKSDQLKEADRPALPTRGRRWPAKKKAVKKSSKK